MVMGQGQGQPGWMHGWFQFWINLQHPHPHFFAYATAVIETVIALALVFGFARKYLYIVGALFSLTIWGTAEGFGGPYGPGLYGHRRRGHVRRRVHGAARSQP